LKKPIQEFQVGHIKRGHTQKLEVKMEDDNLPEETQQKKQKSALESGN